MPDSMDDLDALRSVIEALEPFDAADRERVLRWACEKLGIAIPQVTRTVSEAAPVPLQPLHTPPPPRLRATARSETSERSLTRSSRRPTRSSLHCDVEVMGIEPTTSSMRPKRSSQLSYSRVGTGNVSRACGGRAMPSGATGAPWW